MVFYFSCVVAVAVILPFLFANHVDNVDQNIKLDENNSMFYWKFFSGYSCDTQLLQPTLVADSGLRFFLFCLQIIMKINI